MPRKSIYSPVYRISISELIRLFETSDSLREVCRKIGIKPAGSNYYTLVRRLKECNLSQLLEKFANNFGKGGRRGNYSRIPIEKMLVENSTTSRSAIKRALINKKMLPETCAICGINDIWQNKKLVLILDHINGIYNDNRLENLRLLCPNCNSQTDTFAARNKAYKILRNSLIGKTPASEADKSTFDS